MRKKHTKIHGEFSTEDSDHVTHGVCFILVDQEGRSVKLYNGTGEEDKPFKDYMDDIVKDMQALIKQGA